MSSLIQTSATVELLNKLPMHILNNILGQISEFVSELCKFYLESFDNYGEKSCGFGDDSSAVSQNESLGNSLQYH